MKEKFKAEFKHAEGDIIKALCLTPDRAATILKNAQKNMMEKKPRGSKTQLLEFIVDECETVNELIVGVIEWKGMTDHMQRQSLHAQEQRGGSGIIQPSPGKGIIRPIG